MKIVKSNSKEEAEELFIAVYVYGAGGHANVVKDVLRDMNIKVVGTFDDDRRNVHSAHDDTQPGIITTGVASFERLKSPMIIGIGDNRSRRRIADLLSGPYGIAIHSSAIVSDDVEVGEGSVILQGCIIQTSARLGKHVLINTGAQVDHDNIIGDFCHISPNATLCGYVEIGEGTHIGAGATVIPSVKIGRWCTIGAGAVVIGDVPDYSTVVGNPARIIKRRHIAYRREHLDAVTTNANMVSALQNRQRPGADTSDSYDLTFVGGGLSTTFTLINLLENLINQPIDQAFNILVIDDHDSFFSGLPYGNRSGRSALLITNLIDFLPEPELSQFKQWLSTNAAQLITELEQTKGDRTQKWVADNREDVLSGNVDAIYLPRNWFGRYLKDRIGRLIDQAGKLEQPVKVVTERGEVLSIDQCNRSDSNAGYVLTMNTNKAVSQSRVKSADNQESGDEGKNTILLSQRVVVAIGAPPVSNRLQDIPVTTDTLLIDNPYDPGFDQNLAKLSDFLMRQTQEHPGKANRCLIIGANASSMEFLYHLQDIDSRHLLSHVTIVSPSAKLPQRNRIESNDSSYRYEPSFVNALYSESVVISDDILEAVKLDVDAANSQGIPFRISFPTIWHHVDRMLPKLSRPEKLRFAAHHGVEIGRLQRRMGAEHAEVVEKMLDDDRLSVVQGLYAGSFTSENEGRIELNIELERDGEVSTLMDPVNVIVNCGPVDEVNHETSSTLLSSMLTTGLIVANKSRRGVTVNSRLEAEHGLYFIGPTLAGNIIDDVIVWHAEHCGRLLNLSGKLATNIHESLIGDEHVVESETALIS